MSTHARQLAFFWLKLRLRYPFFGRPDRVVELPSRVLCAPSLRRDWAPVKGTVLT